MRWCSLAELRNNARQASKYHPRGRRNTPGSDPPFVHALSLDRLDQQQVVWVPLGLCRNGGPDPASAGP